MTWPTGAIGTIELYDPDKEIYKINIDSSNYKDDYEPHYIKAARSQYDALEKSLDLELICAWTSKPKTTSQFPEFPSIKYSI